MDMDFDSNIDDWNEDIDLVDEDWEALNGNRWYQENPAISYRTDAVASEGGTTLDDWQRSIRNVRREIDIGGKTLQEVESASSRVRFGEVFSSFKEFEFSVDCWCVINMRSSSKFKTKSNMRVRVCRFGLAVRKKGMGNIREWPGNSESQPVSQRDVPHVLGLMMMLKKKKKKKILKNSMLATREKMNRVVRDLKSPNNKRSDIPALCERIQDADPGGLIDWDTFENSCTFRRAFICPSATRGILRYCEKVVALDACFTKNKKYPTQLFLASVMDGNSQVVPLAYAVVPVENYENWSWFLHNLQISIQGLRSEAVMIVSDRQKALERAVTEILPCNPHMHCGHHLKMNVQKLFGKMAYHVFQNLLHAKSEDRFNFVKEEAEARLDQGSEFRRYIQRIDPARYALYAMPLPRYGRTTSNVVECMNAALKRIRDYAPCRIICQMWLYLLNLFCEQREKANSSTDELTSIGILFSLFEVAHP
ncbi:hypothetical protein R1sor_004261 [Riccia sorocarpa]|uniref:MULE transposase domain-containing protein n=1 Tax=Riccia sorocarpa TaxID=122646 RepID=A0ABD3HA14_9MARC